MKTNSKAKRLGLATAVALTMLLGYNVVIATAARASLRQAARERAERVAPEVNCVFLGNSLVEAGVNAEAFAATWPGGAIKPLNLALGATTPVEHCLILKRALQGPAKVKYLVYGFFDDQLSAPVNGDWNKLIGNRALSYYYPEEAAELYEPGSLWKRVQLHVAERVPMLAERSSLWGEVEKARRSLESMGMPVEASNRFGRVEDFAALAARDAAEFTARCEKLLADGAEFSRPVRELIRLGREHGATVVIVEMPMPTRHRQVFYAAPVWSRMHRRMQELAWQEGAVYVSAANWVADDENFADPAHLNENGAKIFSERLASALGKLEPERSPPVNSGLAEVAAR